MRFRWLLLPALLLATIAGAVVRYDMPKAELLQELGKPTSVLRKGNREVLIYPNNVRIEIEEGKVVSVKGIDLVAAEAAAANPPPVPAAPAEAKSPAEPGAKTETKAGAEEDDEDLGPTLTPEQQKALAEMQAKLEKESAAASAKATAEIEKAITDLEEASSQPAELEEHGFAVLDFVVELVVKWLLMLAALKLTAKYWGVDIEWQGLMLASAADTAVRAVVIGVGEGLLGMFSVFYADEAIAAVVLVMVLRKVSTNQSLQQAVTVTLTSKVFSIVVGSFLSVVALRALH